MKNESTEPAWSGYEQDIPVAQGSVQPAHNGSVAGSNPAVDTNVHVAQRKEQRTSNSCVDGSNPSVDTSDLETALGLMDKHWAGYQNAKELIRACCTKQCLPHQLQYCDDGVIRPVTRVPVIEGLDEGLRIVDRPFDTWNDAWGPVIKAARAYAELQKGGLPSSVDTNRKEV